jgi:hypothetical protein
MPAAHDIYAEQLDTLQRGHALYYPEPCQGTVEIGDVGYTKDGAFFRLHSHSTARRNEVQPLFWRRQWSVKKLPNACILSGTSFNTVSCGMPLCNRSILTSALGTLCWWLKRPRQQPGLLQSICRAPQNSASLSQLEHRSLLLALAPHRILRRLAQLSVEEAHSEPTPIIPPFLILTWCLSRHTGLGHIRRTCIPSFISSRSYGEGISQTIVGTLREQAEIESKVALIVWEAWVWQHWLRNSLQCNTLSIHQDLLNMWR